MVLICEGHDDGRFRETGTRETGTIWSSAIDLFLKIHARVKFHFNAVSL
jgi:hypothetical protein